MVLRLAQMTPSTALANFSPLAAVNSSAAALVEANAIASQAERAETDRFGVEFVSTQADVPAGLWERCFPAHLEGRWWYEVLEASHLDDQFTFFYAVIRHGAAAVGVAPVFLMRLPLSVVIPDALLPLVRPLGSLGQSLLRPLALFVGSPCADEGTVGLLQGVDRRPALLGLQRAMEGKMQEAGASLLVWKDFPDSYADDLRWVSERQGMFRAVSYPGTLVMLPGSKEDYYQSLSSSRRQRYKRMLRRSADRLKVRAEVIRQPDAETLEEMFALFWQAYEHGRTKFEVLNRHFFDRVAREPVSHFVVIREEPGGKMVAFMLCFVLDGRVINKFVGIDCERPRNLFLKARLWDAVIDWAISIGARSIQSGQTGYATKLMTGHALVPLSNFCLHRNPIMHAIFRLVGTRIRWQTLDPELKAAIAAHPEIEADQDAR